ncbi:class I SAM-dependent methyltransferase [Pontibacter anaerobius]|uniref:Class I SAM-dependent methyltransferase n=1 Tax=Pontibacter anaerobius TaxID=2993940 RepID=A0ABT3RD17_9BACT|nr:class I SAM-dependent methyltransferase [Pontibacter anaerobius]MCX2739318.1 class I SAM-dependent methyltransferase [Pontibacter anaerobius]
MKDNFSVQAAAYAAFRPHYPQELYDFLYSLPIPKDTAWDCATGNGQVAAVLAKVYKKVYASDISAAQLQHAPKLPNISYLTCPAESTPIPDKSIDLVTVAQAVHWFQFDKFNQEVRRMLRPHGWLAIWGYGLLQTDDEGLNNLIQQFYAHTLGPYWDAERRYIDEKYTSIPFPFKETTTPELNIAVDWTRQQFLGYLSSWSSVQHYLRQNGESPIPAFEGLLQNRWPSDKSIGLRFPVFMQLGQV